MPNIVLLSAGGVASYASAGFTLTDFNNRTNGGFVLGTTTIDNSTNLDLMAEVSGQFTVGGTTTAAHWLALWLLKLNRDGATWGCGTGTGTALPAAHQWMANAMVRAGVTSGGIVTFDFPPILLPRATFRFGISQHLGAALNASAAAQVMFRTTNFNTNG
jgi:hypothetical protein